MENIVFSSIKQ